MTGKAKTAIAEFAYCGRLYKGALKTLQGRFGQPQAVVSPCLDNLSNIPSLEMYSSESVIRCSATIYTLIGKFRSLHYHPDLCSVSLSGQATQKLPPNLKGTSSLYTVKKNWDLPTLLEVNEWLKNKAETHERMQLSLGKLKTENSNPPANVMRTQTRKKNLRPPAPVKHRQGETKPTTH